MKDYILAIGGSWAQSRLVNLIKELGFLCVLCDYDRDCEGRTIADAFEEISTTDIEGLIGVAEHYSVVAVASTQSDSGIFSATKVAAALGLKHLSEGSLDLFTNKASMRSFLMSNGYNCPRFRLCYKKDDIEAFVLVDKCDYPIVIKPVISQGSRGVEIIDAKDELDGLNFESIQENNQHGIRGVIAEDYLGNEEYTVEGIVVNGKHYSLGVSKKEHYDDHPCVSRELRYTWENDYYAFVQQHDMLIEKSGLEFGITHSEYIKVKNEYFLVEFAARGGGSMISSHIVPAISGWDVEKIYLQELLGITPSIHNVERKCAVLRFIELMDKKRIRKIDGIDRINSCPFVLKFSLRYKEGDLVEPVCNDTNRHGFFIVCAENKDELNDRISYIENTLEVSYY